LAASRQFSVPEPEIAALCQKWQVRELSLFGSAARGELQSDSDVDVLVTFESDATWNLWDLGQFAEELVDLFGRDVDLVEERSLVNPFRRRAILRDKRVVYAA
jgi:predicted nucleotidyltransferase